jgi:hypothetical protein
MTTLEEAPRRPTVRDVSAIVGLLAVLEGEVWGADTGDDRVPEWARRLGARLGRDGLISADAGNEELRRALGDLGQRMRYVLGEHDDPDPASA